MPSNNLILRHPLLLLPPIPPSIRVFSNASVVPIRWPKYWRFSFSISLSNEYSGLISFRIDWLDILAVQRTLKSLLQIHSLKASILQRSAFFISPTLTSMLTIGKTIVLTRWTFVGKIISLLFNMLSRFFIAFFLSSKAYSCLGNPMNSMKRQKDMTLKDQLPRSVDAQYATGEVWRNNYRKNEETEPEQKQCQSSCNKSCCLIFTKPQ